MDSSIINELFSISILCLILTIAHSHPIVSRSTDCVLPNTGRCASCNKCPGSVEKKASLLKQFKQFHPRVTNKTIVIRNGLLVLSATEHEVKFIKPSNIEYNYNLNCSNPELFFYKFEYTVNGSRMMSLVPVGSPDRIVTWGPVDIGSGDIINVNSITYELKTENITDVFSMLSSNETNYDANWRFQMEFTRLTNVKILTERGDLLVTNNYDHAALQRRIGDDDNWSQINAICQDCRSDWCSV